jgi:hypothetical protein
MIHPTRCTWDCEPTRHVAPPVEYVILLEPTGLEQVRVIFFWKIRHWPDPLRPDPIPGKFKKIQKKLEKIIFLVKNINGYIILIFLIIILNFWNFWEFILIFWITFEFWTKTRPTCPIPDPTWPADLSDPTNLGWIVI